MKILQQTVHVIQTLLSASANSEQRLYGALFFLFCFVFNKSTHINYFIIAEIFFKLSLILPTLCFAVLAG